MKVLHSMKLNSKYYPILLCSFPLGFYFTTSIFLHGFFYNCHWFLTITDCYFVLYINSTDMLEILNSFFQLSKEQTVRLKNSQRSFDSIFYKQIFYKINQQTNTRNFVIIRKFHLISRCGNFVKRHIFRIVLGDSSETARNYVESVPFRKISTPGNQGKLRNFTQ